jgi:predicted SAM-dependent methyltransferase
MLMQLDDLSLRRSCVRYSLARRSPQHMAAFAKPEPLVTVIITTYNRADKLRTRSLPSILRQTYKNLEVLVVGDGCTDGTAEAVASFNDPRVTYVALEGRPDYEAFGGWAVAGTRALNKGLELAQGEFITHLDDDDEHVDCRIEVLVAIAQKEKADFIFHSFLAEQKDGRWARVQSPDGALRHATVTTSSTFYHRFFKDLPWDMECWNRYKEPGDWNRFRKLNLFKPVLVYLREDLLIHYREGQNAYGGPRGLGMASLEPADGLAKLHIGCGQHHLEGWVNIDLDAGSKADLRLDVTKGLPVADGSVGAVLTQHFIEHLTRAQAQGFLAECCRVLKPGGKLRVSTPDLAAIVRDYTASLTSGHPQCHWDDPGRYRSACHVFNTAIDCERAWGHQFSYDEPELRQALADAGFSEVKRCAADQVDPVFYGLEASRPPCLVFEASKAVSA